MKLAVVLGFASSLVACGWSGFEPRNRELVECWPSCGPDAEVAPDVVVEMDAGVLADGGDAFVPVDLGVDAGEPPDSGEEAPDAGRDGGLELFLLDAELSTAHTITFAWDPARVPANAEGYVLRYSTTLADVQNGGGMIWDAEDDPNLGYRTSPHGPGLVHRTTVAALLPGMTYFARLYAVMPAMGPVPVADGTGHTLAEPEAELVLFAEELALETAREGFLEPELSAMAHSGTRALWFVAPEVAFEGFIADLGILFPDTGEVRFANAFLEMWIYVDFVADPQPTFFVRTNLAGSSGGSFSYVYTALPVRLGWVRVELAFAGFEAEGGGPLTQLELGDHVARFGIAGVFPQGATVYVDDVVVRY